MDDIQKLNEWFSFFYPIGADPAGGVTRLGYSQEENDMHDALAKIAADEGLRYTTDKVGNSIISLNNKTPYYLIGSHLDSVPRGGRYDGVAGLLAGLLVMRHAKSENSDMPVRLAAFRCEESSRFGRATVGSGLATGQLHPEDLDSFHDKNGVTLKEAITYASFSPEPYTMDDLRGYIELHIEQGRVLYENGRRIGVVSSIAAPTRFNLKIYGRQDHSGATPMDMRKDGLAFASEVVLLVEKLGMQERDCSSVATVGSLRIEPGVMNVVPGYAELGIDIRGIDKDSIMRITDGFKSGLAEISKRRGIRYELTQISAEDPVRLSPDMIEGLRNSCLPEDIEYIELPSGAGHDAMNMARVTRSGMLFIPCREGISHNPDEYAEMEDIALGARIIHRFLREGF